MAESASAGKASAPQPHALSSYTSVRMWYSQNIPHVQLHAGKCYFRFLYDKDPLLSEN